MSLLWMFLITVAILQTSVFVTTIYLHRAMCHRGLDLHPVVANLMHLQLSLFTGIVPREWVAVHRKHHHFSDKEGDPHSPYLRGLWQVFLGNYFFYREECQNQATIRKYTPDHRPDVIDRIPGIRYGVFGGLAIFMLMFGWAWGLAAWAFHVVGYILLNSGVNSFCHWVGYRNFGNKATNFTFWAWITGGEGLHNNHHEFPSSAKFALRGREIDPAWPIIRTLEAFGLARVHPEPLAKAA
jgi:stearoyl-CoA desaturase (Delta-9 desaturase)